MTLGRHVFLTTAAARSMVARTEPGARLIAHEIEHVSQFARVGFLRFAIRYLIAYARGRFRGLSHDAAYTEIPFEVEARNAEESAMWKAGLSLEHAPAAATAALPARPSLHSRFPIGGPFLPAESDTDEPEREG